MDPSRSYKVFSEYLDEDELNKEERWLDVEGDEEGNFYATSGTVDLEYYIKIKY